MIGAFSISGFPLWNGFISKSMVTAAAVGDHLLDALRTLAARYPSVREVRGKGLMVALEIEYKKG